MYELYKRVRKSREFPKGSRQIEDKENPFLEGPCLLCVAALDIQDDSAFGMSKEGMRMARLRIKEQPNAKFDIKGFPVSFLSLKLSSENSDTKKSGEEQLKEFADTYFTPLISSDGDRLDCETAMRNMRNVNIISYCDGTLKAQGIEKFVVMKMQELGYTEEEISKIQSQMCMLPIATNRLSGIQKSTCIAFKDINDGEVNDDVTQEEIEQVNKSPIGETIIRYSPNESAYLINGSGEHSLKEYRTNGSVMPVCLSSVVTKVLENSIANSNKTVEFIPLSMEDLLSEISRISKQFQEGKTMEELREELDNSLKYGGAKRLSDDEIELLDQVDEVYEALDEAHAETMKVKKELGYETDKHKRTTEKFEQFKDATKECTSDTTFKIISAKSGYQYPRRVLETFINLPTDREIIDSMSEEKKPTVTTKDIVETSIKQEITSSEISDSQKLIKGIINNKVKGGIGDESK